jgi:hypothetical protein
MHTYDPYLTITLTTSIGHSTHVEPKRFKPTAKRTQPGTEFWHK